MPSLFLIDRQDDADNVTLEELMQFVKGPDFPTGGIIVGSEGIRNAYATGRGRIVIRAVATVQDNPNKPGRQQIEVTELPYQVNKSLLIQRIAELVNKGVISDISDLRDASDRRGISIVVELKRGTQPMKVLNQLYQAHQSANDLRRTDVGPGRSPTAAVIPKAGLADSYRSSSSGYHAAYGV